MYETGLCMRPVPGHHYVIINFFQDEVTMKIMGKFDDINPQEFIIYPQRNNAQTHVCIFHGVYHYLYTEFWVADWRP